MSFRWRIIFLEEADIHHRQEDEKHIDNNNFRINVRAEKIWMHNESNSGSGKE
jgi:hypothetical protein